MNRANLHAIRLSVHQAVCTVVVLLGVIILFGGEAHALPPAPGIPDLVSGSDSGSSNTDDYTNDNTPSFTITCQAGASVNLREGANSRATGTCPGGGTITLTSSSVSDGVKNYFARQTDGTGTGPDSSTIAVTIDTSNPTSPNTPDLQAASDSGSSSTDNYTNVTTPTFTIGGCTDGLTVQLREGSTVLGSGTCSGGTVDITSSTLSSGGHVLDARQVDLAGNNSSNSTNLNITIDTTAPGTPGVPNLFSSSDSGTSNTDEITNDTTPTFSVSCSNGAFVELLDGVTVIGSATCFGSSENITSTTLSEGDYIITARQTDTAGNVSGTSSGLPVTIDTTPPNTAGTPDLLDASDSGQSNTDDLTNDTTPTFTVPCDAGLEVDLREGGTTRSTGTCGGGGTVNLTSSSLSDGAHSISARQSDVAGNSSSNGTALSITIDTVEAAPGTPDLDPDYDSGSSNSDDLTNIDSPIFNISCNDGTFVELLDGVSTVVGSGTCAGVAVSIQSSVLGDGLHSIRARQTDLAGNTSSNSGALSVTIDTGAPTAPGIPDLTNASDSGASNSDDLTNVTTPTFRISCTTGVVSLAEGVTILGTGTCSGGFVNITSSLLGDGAHSVFAFQTDSAGNVSQNGGSRVVTIDTVAPEPPGTPDLSDTNDSGVANDDNITNVTTPEFTMDCDEDGNVVELLENGNILGSGTCSDGTVTVTSSSLADGVYDIYARETDTAGNVSSDGGSLSVTIDTAAPNVPTTPDLQGDSDTGASNSDDITSDTTPTFAIECAEEGNTVTLLEGSTELGTGTCESNLVSITSSSLSEGAHTVVAHETDTAGNTSSDSSGLTVTIDSVAPATPGTPDLQAGSDSGSSSTDDNTNVTTPTVDVTCDQDGDSIEILEEATVLGSGVCSSGTVSITLSALVDGVHSVFARAKDVAGNSATSGSLDITVDTAANAPSTPDLDDASDTGSSESDDITGDNTPSFTMTCETGATVELVEGTTVMASGTCVDGSVTLTSSTVSPDGTHDFFARQTDVAGNASSDSSTLTITLDTTALAAPDAPDLQTDSGASNTDNVTNDNTPSFLVACAGAAVSIYDDGIPMGLAQCSSGSAVVTTSALLDGPHTITATQSDIAGNESAASSGLSILIDTVAPDAPAITSPADGSLVENPTPDITGTSEADATIDVLDDGSSIGTTAANGGGAWTFTPGTPLATGSHPFTATATDLAGNTSAPSAAVTVDIDQDSDGDGVLDTQEGGTDDADGDGIANVNDPDSRNSVTIAQTYVEPWNGFLRQVNIAEIRNNRGDKSIKIRPTMRTRFGSTFVLDDITIGANAQQDVVINSLPGFAANDYGTIKLEGLNLDDTPLAPGDFDGQISVYRLAASTFTDFDFAYAIPFTGAKQGDLTASYNTYQPSLNPSEQGFLVANYVQLSNFEAFEVHGTLQYFDDGGNLIQIAPSVFAEPVTLQANQRADSSIHDIVGASRVGIVRWVPDSGFETARVGLQVNRYLYLNNTFSSDGTDTFAGVISVEGVKGRSGPIVLPMDTTSSTTAVAEVANVSGSSIPVTIEAFDADGVSKQTLNFTLNAHATFHDIGDSLFGGSVGSIVVSSTTPGALYATVVHYTRGAGLSVVSSRSLRGSDQIGTTLYGSLNSFLAQTCRILITNSGSQTETVSLLRFDFSGTQVGSALPFNLPANGTTATDACTGFPANSYGKFQLVPANHQAKFSATAERDQADYTMSTDVRP